MKRTGQPATTCVWLAVCLLGIAAAPDAPTAGQLSPLDRRPREKREGTFAGLQRDTLYLTGEGTVGRSAIPMAPVGSLEVGRGPLGLSLSLRPILDR